MSAHCQQQWSTTLGEATPAVGSRGAFAAWHELIASAEVKNSARTSRNRSESASAERVNPSGEQQHLAWSIKDVPRRFTGDSVPRSFSLPCSCCTCQARDKTMQTSNARPASAWHAARPHGHDCFPSPCRLCKHWAFSMLLFTAGSPKVMCGTSRPSLSSLLSDMFMFISLGSDLGWHNVF